MEPQDREAINRLASQLKAIKIMLAVFMVMILVSLAVVGYMVWTVVAFTRDVTEKVTQIQTTTTENLDFKKKLCDNRTITNFLNDKSEFCKE